MNKQCGFTLVEVIVTSVIIAILSATAITLYQGYVAETRQEMVNTIAQTAAASANSLVRKTGTNLSSSDSAKLDLFFPEPDRFTLTIAPESGSLHGIITISDIKYGVVSNASY